MTIIRSIRFTNEKCGDCRDIGAEDEDIDDRMRLEDRFTELSLNKTSGHEKNEVWPYSFFTHCQIFKEKILIYTTIYPLKFKTTKITTNYTQATQTTQNNEFTKQYFT